MLGVVKRARWPADLEEAKAGGFVVGYSPVGAPIYRNPCTAQFLLLLPNVLALIRYACVFYPALLSFHTQNFFFQTKDLGVKGMWGFLMTSCFSLLLTHRTHNSLFMPDNRARLSETFSRAHEVMDAEKNVILGERSIFFFEHAIFCS